MRRRIVVFVVLLFTIWQMETLCGEEIFMRNGDKLSGKLSSVVGDSLVIDTDYGQIKVEKEKVAKVVFSRGQNSSEKFNVLEPTIEDILIFIKNSSKKFYVDGKRMSGESFSNSIRLKKMMSYPELKDIHEFTERFLVRSESGKLIKILENGKKINLVDWLDSNISTLKLKRERVRNKKRKFEKMKRK